MKKGAAVVLLNAGLSACSPAQSDQGTLGSDRLADGQQLVCVPGDGASVREPYAGPGGAASRMPIGREFRVRYLVTEGDANAGLAPMTAVVVFQHTIPRVEQVHFPKPVGDPSANFLRSKPGGFMLFQLDPWNSDEAKFAWAERDNGVSFVAHGTCRIDECRRGGLRSNKALLQPVVVRGECVRPERT